MRVERARVLRVIGRLERMPASDAAPLDFLWANEGGEQYEVWIRAEEGARVTTAAIEQMTVPTQTPGRSVRLSDVVEIGTALGPASIQRLARQRSVTIYCNVVPGTSEAGVIAAFNDARDRLHMEPGFTAELAGRSKELGRAGQSFAIAFILSLVFMYLVLAAQFESWIHPVTILMARRRLKSSRQCLRAGVRRIIGVPVTRADPCQRGCRVGSPIPCAPCAAGVRGAGLRPHVRPRPDGPYADVVHRPLKRSCGTAPEVTANVGSDHRQRWQR